VFFRRQVAISNLIVLTAFAEEEKSIVSSFKIHSANYKQQTMWFRGK